MPLTEQERDILLGLFRKKAEVEIQEIIGDFDRMNWSPHTGFTDYLGRAPQEPCAL